MDVTRAWARAKRAIFRLRRRAAQVTGADLEAGFIVVEDVEASIRDAARSSVGKR